MPAATLAIVLITREHSRPEQELLHILRQYQGLEAPSAASDAVKELKTRNWLCEYQTYGMTLLRQTPDLLVRVAALIHEAGVTEKLRHLRSLENPYLSILGSMNGEEVYTSYIDRIKGAHSIIRLPMLATSPDLNSVPILKDRAARGVEVRVLLGSVRVVCQLRGANMKETATRAIEGWRAHSKECPNIKVRVTDNIDDMLMATCMLVDDGLLRYDIYDSRKQRSLQGIMFEVISPPELNLNIIAWFKRTFDDAWGRGYSPTTVGWIAKFLLSNWHWLLFGIFVFMSLCWSQSPLLFAVFTSSAASFLVSGLIASSEPVLSFIQKRGR